MKIKLWLFLFALLIFVSNQLPAQTLPQVIKQIKPSIVGIGTLQTTRRPPSKLMGTGFVVADGYHVITNYHVLPKDINTDRKEHLVIFYGRGKQVKYRKVRALS
jgi:S1-C subfamily serine protease